LVLERFARRGIGQRITHGNRITDEVEFPVTDEFLFPFSLEVGFPITEELEFPINDEIHSPRARENRNSVTDDNKSVVADEVEPGTGASNTDQVEVCVRTGLGDGTNVEDPGTAADEGFDANGATRLVQVALTDRSC
jgi:hypothetical protein